MARVPFKELKGKTIKKITGEVGDREMYFETIEGEKYRLIYHQDCCAGCDIDDICGDLEDLIGHPILVAEEVDNIDEPRKCDRDESYTWVFYKLDTIKGGVTIKWYGQSNGYYSERADFEKFERGAWERWYELR